MKKSNLTDRLHALTPPVKERKSDALRRNVVDTFIAQVGKLGFEATTLDLVAQELGMRRNHVGYYFPSRASLLSAAVLRVISLGQQITIQQMQVAKNPEQALDAWVGGAFDWLELFPHHGKVMLVFYSQCPFNKDFAKISAEIWDVGLERISTLLQSQGFSAIDTKKFKEALRDIQTYNLGVIIQRLTAPKPAPWKDVKAVALGHARAILKPLKRGRAGTA